jgi:DNA repair protein SbcD/Mre11
VRFIHTADWHLGRTFQNVPLIEDQAYVLNQIIQLARDEKPDAVVISGDLYDRGVPALDAVNLLDDVLSALALDVHVPIILIAGNHDSPGRLEFGSRLLESHRLLVYGKPCAAAKYVELYDDHGPVRFYLMPYAEPVVLREHWNNPAVTSHDSAYQILAAKVRADAVEATRSVLVGHCYVGGGNLSESERPLAIGGAEYVAAQHLTPYHYAALGHLHRPQTLGINRHIHYPGSLLKYSFSEHDHTKSVNLVEMDARGHGTVQRIRLTPKREVRCIEGYLETLLEHPNERFKQDFIRVRLQDEGALLDAMGRLRTIYPFVMELERPNWLGSLAGPRPRPEQGTVNVVQRFDEFFRQVTGGDITSEERNIFCEIVERLAQTEGEAIA